MKKLVFVILILVFALFAGCSKFGGDSKGAASLKADVVAQVGDEKIMAKDIEEILTHIPPQYRARYSTEQGRREIVNGLVDIKMLAWEAKNRGLDKNESVKMKIRYLTDQALAKELESELKKSYKVTDADIQKYYNDHQEKYASPVRIKASQILVDSQAQADTILKQLKKGAAFDALAKQYSKDPSGQRGGDMGWFPKGKMDSEFDKQVFALKKGELSGVVKTPAGYHIVRVEDIRESATRTLEQVKRPIERIIQRERIEKEVTGLKEGIKKKANVAVNEEYFKKFAGQPEPAIPGMEGPGMQMPGQSGMPMAAPGPRMGPAAAPGGAPAAPGVGK